MHVLSYGGGIQTVALSILSVKGKVYPRADCAIFADTGAEMPETYEHVEIMKRWLTDRDMPFVTLKNYVDGPLEEYVRERSTVIPVHTDGGIGRRQCTSKWKIEVIERHLRGCGAKEATIDLGISLDEYHRMKPSKTKWITNRFPLIDLRLSRTDCRRIIEAEGLPVPPKSACYFCPFHRHSTWQNLATHNPELFERAASLEDAIRSRRDINDGGAYLASTKRPLRQSFSPDQLPLDLPEADDQCGGYCFT